MKFEAACMKYLKEEQLHQGWIGVDLDGTLAEYYEDKNVDVIGKPIIPMVNRVKNWIKEGKTVKIFTARASETKYIPAIKQWLKENNLPELEITNIKDRQMIEYWDDRAVQVTPNTGIPVSELDISVNNEIISNTQTEKETKMHIQNVGKFILTMIKQLVNRGINHDDSKLKSPEKEIFETNTPKLKGLTYGSEEYSKQLKEMKPALDHHYSVSRHHPEHHVNGIDDMNLIDLCEMLSDWKAATLRHNDGDIRKSIEINSKRFKMSEQTKRILQNTIDYLKW